MSRRPLVEDNPEYRARMSHIMEESQELQSLVRAEYYPLNVVPGLDGLRNIKGFNEAYITGRNRYTQKYTGEDKSTLAKDRTQYWVLAGRTLAYKRGAASQLVHLGRNDPYTYQKLGTSPEMLYTGFASAAILAQIEGRIPANEGHGTYSYTSYREGSNTLTMYVTGQSPNYEKPKWMVVETTGPAAYLSDNGRIKGPDRGFSTQLQLAAHYGDQTEVIALMRKRRGGIYKKGLAFRQDVEDAEPKDMPKVLEKHKTNIADDKGGVIDISTWSHEKLAILRQELLQSQAPPKGVERSNRETDALMKYMGIKDEEEFWSRLLINEVGFKPANCHIVENPFTQKIFSLYHDVLGEIDPIKKQIEFLKSLKAA